MIDERIKLVRGDTRPSLILSLRDSVSQAPLDLSDVSASARLKFRRIGDTALTATLVAQKLVGILQDDGNISLVAPYDVGGKGGRLAIAWTSDALLGPAGDYEGEIEVTFADGTVQTLYSTLKFRMRDQLG